MPIGALARRRSGVVVRDPGVLGQTLRGWAIPGWCAPESATRPRSFWDRVISAK